MRYFASINDYNVVLNVYSTDGEDLSELDKNLIEYSEDTSITNNMASIGYSYDSNLNAFIPPQTDPTYILNTQTFEWEPDENLEYDLHGDGKLYRYNKEVNGWIPTWEPEDDN